MYCSLVFMKFVLCNSVHHALCLMVVRIFHSSCSLSCSSTNMQHFKQIVLLHHEIFWGPMPREGGKRAVVPDRLVPWEQGQRQKEE